MGSSKALSPTWLGKRQPYADNWQLTMPLSLTIKEEGGSTAAGGVPKLGAQVVALVVKPPLGAKVIVVSGLLEEQLATVGGARQYLPQVQDPYSWCLFFVATAGLADFLDFKRSALQVVAGCCCQQQQD